MEKRFVIHVILVILVTLFIWVNWVTLVVLVTLVVTLGTLVPPIAAFKPSSGSNQGRGKKNWHFLGLRGAPRFRIEGAEDNFIFDIEYCLFFALVKKLRRDYNILKQF